MFRYRPLAVLPFAVAALLPAGCGQPEVVAKPTVAPLLPDKLVRVKWDATPTPSQEAVLQALEADRTQFHAAFEPLQLTDQPSAVARCIAAYVKHLDGFDQSGCPTEFRNARTKYAAAWGKLQTALGRHADAFGGSEVVDALSALFRGNPAAGKVLGGDVIEAVKQVKDAFSAVHKSAMTYGLDVTER